MKIATIGSGFIVDHFIESGRLVDGVEFVAVSSRTMDRARQFADKHGIKKAYDSIELMLQDLDIDTIYVASPNSLHYEQTMQAIAAGKHVIVEKPFAGNLTRAYEVFNAAKAKGVYVFEAITTIHLPNFKSVKASIEKLGKISVVHANMSQYSSRYDALLRGEIPNVFNPNFGGGALADINVYNIHFIVGLFGKPTSVNYIARRHENGVDLSGIVTLTYPDFNATLVGAKDSASPNYAIIQGEAGHLSIPSSTSMITKLSVVTKSGTQEHNVQDKPQHMYQQAVFQDIISRKDDQAYEELVQHSLEVMDVVEKARQAIGMYYEF